MLWKSTAGRAQEAGPAGPAQEPGHVRRRGRRRADHRTRRSPTPSVFNWTIVVWLWLTVVFANLAEAVAEGRGKAQAETLRRTKRETDGPPADRLAARPGRAPRRGGARHRSCTLGDYVVVEAGEVIPGDGDVVEGIASVDESAITGESAPVIRESGGDRSRGHRRHHGAVRPDRREDHLQAGRDLHRPDDRPGRGRQAAEDAERDRAEHPARRADDHLHARGDHAAADGVLLQGAADAWSSWSRCSSR